MPAIGLDIGGSSVKGTLLIEHRSPATARSDSYTRPDLAQLTTSLAGVLDVLRTALAQSEPNRAVQSISIGVCLPGVIEPGTGRIRGAVNLPALVGVQVAPWIESLLSTTGWAHEQGELTVTTDAAAAAVDLAYEPGAAQPFAGRLAAISIGTGVGLGIVDAGVPLRVEGDSAGHLGQVDVAVPMGDGSIPLGPDGGRGSLEAYCTARALQERFGPGWRDRIASLAGTDPCLVALARAIRIVHAIYRPGIVAIAGGVGLMLRQHADQLVSMVRSDLTSAADPGWSLRWAGDTMHAAAGAARIASARAG